MTLHQQIKVIIGAFLVTLSQNKESKDGVKKGQTQCTLLFLCIGLLQNALCLWFCV